MADVSSSEVPPVSTGKDVHMWGVRGLSYECISWYWWVMSF